MAAVNEPGPPPSRFSVFVDTSVLFAAVLSESGGSRLILKLGEAGAIQLRLSRQVLREAEGALRKKAPQALTTFSLLLDRTGLQIVASAPAPAVAKLSRAVGHAGDAQIAADAATAGVHYLVTLDKAHLLGNRKLAKVVSFPIGSPSDFLAWYRASLLP